MAKDLTFESACQIVKGEYPELVNDIDRLSSIVVAAGTIAAAVPIAVAIGPAVLTPAAIILTAVGTLSNLFGVKNEILAISGHIIAKVTSKREKDTLKMFEHMQQAYTLICYTAFFEALYREKELAPLLKKIHMTGEEKCNTIMYTAKDLLGKGNTQVSETEMSWLKFVIDLPQPGDTPETQHKLLLPLYQLLTHRIRNFFELEIVKKQIQEDGGLEKIKSALGQVPEEALKSFKGQYYGLAMKYPEFAIWLNLQEKERDRTLLHEEMAEHRQKLTELVEHGQKALDIGFKHMEEVIRSVPQQIEQRQIDVVLQRLETWYINTVNKPIIDDPQQALIYPKKSEIFIPQAFQVLHYTGEHLEQNQTWNHLPVRDDLSSFLLSYFNHPKSIHTPLIILGQPGSGKSLLTSMLAARLIISASSYTSIRVELRHVDTEASIPVQIKDQIYKDTDLQRTWGELAQCIGDRPPLVIFDGYDELLQATGKAFAGYLKDIEDFQEGELTRGQKPVCTIVTSRISLIDKANIPKNATVIQLLEFDHLRQSEWIARWNDTNSTYFEQAQVRPFTLPQNNVSLSKLAEQPLLLMMLALYDSVGNPLLSAKAIDQTLLYNELLRRFIERELKKDERTSRSWQKEELDKAIDREMERLGVAAIGMFNRRRLYITKEDLNNDLKFFDLEKNSLEIEGRHISSTRGRDLLPAEKMFGSFFFQQLTAVRKSTEPTTDYRPQRKGDDVAYEFLHNTFGEFLTADFILHKILEETAALHHLAGVKVLRSMLSQKIEQFDGVEPGWFARFIYAPLFSRPVIVNLLREWSQHCLRREQRDEKQFLTDFDTIVMNHINLLFTTNTLPSLVVKSEQNPFANLPIIGYLAIYTLNLLLLRTLLAPEGYIFDEAKYTPSADGTRAWDHLTYLWRSWFSLETLNELAAILTAERDNTTIHLNVKKLPGTSQRSDRLNLIYNVGQTLADNITAGLSGFLLHDSFRADKAELDTISERLRSEQLSESFMIDMFKKRLRHLRRNPTISMTELNSLNQEFRFLPIDKNSALYLDAHWHLNLESLTSFLSEMTRLAQKTIDLELLDIYKYFVIGPIGDSESADEVTKEIIKLAKETNHLAALDYFSNRYLQEVMKKKRKISDDLLMELIKIGQGAIPLISQYIRQVYLTKAHKKQSYISIPLVVQMIKFAREVGDQILLDYFNQDYLEELLKPQTYMTTELAIEMLKLVREMGNQANLNQLIIKSNELIEKLLQRNFSTSDLYLPATELIIELLKSTIQIENREILRNLVPTIRLLLRKETKYLLLKVDLSILILKFTHKINDKKLLDIICRNYLPDILQSQELGPIELVVELLKLLTQNQDTYPLKDVESYYRKNITLKRFHLGSLPLDTIIDLRSIAQLFGDDELVQRINAKLGL